jgi:hypothetical protein
MGRFTVPYRFHDAFAYGSAVLIVAAGWLIRHEIAQRGLGTVRPAPAMARTAVTAPVIADTAVTVPVLADAMTPEWAMADRGSPAEPGSLEETFDAFTPRSVAAGQGRGVRA